MLKDNKDPIALQKELAQLTYTLFESPEGKQLLEYWMENYLMAPVAPANYPESYARIREGQNTFIRDIIKAIELHKNPHAFQTIQKEVNTNV